MKIDPALQSRPTRFVATPGAPRSRAFCVIQEAGPLTIERALVIIILVVAVIFLVERLL